MSGSPITVVVGGVTQMTGEWVNRWDWGGDLLRIMSNQCSDISTSPPISFTLSLSHRHSQKKKIPHFQTTIQFTWGQCFLHFELDYSKEVLCSFTHIISFHLTKHCTDMTKQYPNNYRATKQMTAFYMAIEYHLRNKANWEKF